MQIDRIALEILGAVEKKQPVGWYPIEMGLRIRRQDFPAGMNVKTYLESLKEQGLVEEQIVEEKSKFVVTNLGLALLNK